MEFEWPRLGDQPRAKDRDQKAWGHYWPRLAVGLLVAAFLVLNLTLVAWQGVQLGGDTSRYTDGADNILQGRGFQDRQASYPGYVAVVALCEQLGVGLAGVVALQLGVAAGAAVALYDLGRKLGGRGTGVISAALFLANPDIVRWHHYILPDSLYISLVILATWAIYRATERQKGWYLVAAAVVLGAAFVRPNGWILVPIALAFWATRVRSLVRPRWPAVASIAVLAIAGAVAVLCFRTGAEETAMGRMLDRGEVIWGYPEARLQLPVDAEFTSTSLSAAVGYVARHPLESAHIAAARVVTELVPVRPYYSPPHNAVLLVGMPLLYVLALIGLIGVRTQPLVYLLGAVIGSHLLIIALTFASWDGRFVLYVFPLITVFSARGIVDLARAFRRGLPSRAAPAL
jgi:4-amino-4-deoxy-L-arabinose transferase-like glycosyltransferase